MNARKWIAAALAAVLLCPAALAAETAGQGGPAGAEELASLHGRLSGLALAEDGSLLAADALNKVVWKLGDEDTVWAGTAGPADLTGIPTGGYQDGALDKARFASPWAIVPYLDGWVVSDSGNNVLRYISRQKVSTLSAWGLTLENPTGLAVDGSGNLYIADTNRGVVRRLDSSGRCAVWAEGLNEPTGLCWHEDTLYVADSGNHRVCAVKNGSVTVLAGSGAEGFSNGAASQAAFSSPQGLAVDEDGTVYIADTGNGAVRRLRDGVVTTLVQGGGDLLWPVSPRGLLLLNGKLAVSDAFAGVVFLFPLDAIQFSDVAPGTWYYESVQRAASLGLMTGDGDTFLPGQELSRAQAVQLLFNLARAEGRAPALQGTSPFLDVPDGSWFAPAAAWACAQGYATGVGGGLFQPERPVSRQELALFLYRYAGMPAAKTAALDRFPDAGSAAAWAVDALSWAVERGLLSGTPEGLLDPAGPLPRSQAAAILVRYWDGRND